MIDKIKTPQTFMTRKELSKYLGCCISTLDKLDIPRIKLSERRICYNKSDVDSWIESRKETRQENENL